jgi:transcriptional regulator with XRE-family HTH domain
VTGTKHFARRLILGRRLRAARETAGLSQREVAERLGYRQSLISNSETANRRLEIFELQEFAELYGVTLDVLLSPHSQIEKEHLRRLNVGVRRDR